MNLWLNHALDYLAVAESSQSTSKYLVAYYGILNLSRFIISVKSGPSTIGTHHGLSRSPKSTSFLSRYAAKIPAKKNGSLHALASAIGVTMPSGEISLKLTDILRSDLNSSRLASEALGTQPLCLRGDVNWTRYKQVCDHNHLLKTSWKKFAPGYYTDGHSHTGLQSVSVSLYPESVAEMHLIKSKWSRYVPPATDFGVVAEHGSFGLTIPDQATNRIDLAYENDGCGEGIVSICLPNTKSSWPVLLKQFAGAWMLADIVRYSPELFVLQSTGREHELQVASELFMNGVIRSFPLLCLRTLIQEYIVFGPQSYLG